MWPPVGSSGDPPSAGASALHRTIMYAMRYTTSFVSCASTRIGSALTSFLQSALGGRGGRVDIVTSNAAVGHTLVDIIVAEPTRRDLVERAARQDLVAATHAE